MKRLLLLKRFAPHVFFLVISLCAAAFAAYYFFYIPSNTLVLRNDGWHPEELKVNPGETVTFINRTDRPFWPASNSHPQHNLFPEFDTGHPIAPHGSWSFTFDRDGRWAFHDHLRSYYVGTIFVGKDAEKQDCLQSIRRFDDAQKRECWDEKLLQELRAHGAEAAFRLFARFYESDPVFTSIGCHLMAHKLGDGAYGEYVRYKNDLTKLQFPPESVYCGYGYYHGILEHMIRDNPDWSAADTFCKNLIREYADTVPRIRLNCYHAIGHGFVPEPTDVEMWGDARKMAEPAFAACKRITTTDARVECLQGTFNVIGDWMWTNQFGLQFPENDSLSLCRSFSDTEISQACYYELSMRLIPFAKDDLVLLYERYIAEISDDVTAGLIINSAAASVAGAYIADDSFIRFLKMCRAIPERVQTDCVKGITGAFVAHGEPEKEYVKAVAFCSDHELTLAEKSICYENIFRTFKTVYTKEKVGAVCLLIEPEYRKYCAYE